VIKFIMWTSITPGITSKMNWTRLQTVDLFPVHSLINNLFKNVCETGEYRYRCYQSLFISSNDFIPCVFLLINFHHLQNDVPI
jgi:hypothetical protein